MPTGKRKTIPRPVYFETTIPSIRACRGCGVWVAAGRAEGMKVQAEIVVLSPRQIVQAILLGVELCVLRRTGLIHMDALRLSGRNLGYLYPQHYCHVKWPSEVEGAGLPTSRYPDTPPF